MLHPMLAEHILGKPKELIDYTNQCLVESKNASQGHVEVHGDGWFRVTLSWLPSHLGIAHANQRECC
jgi:hypothetical protein